MENFADKYRGAAFLTLFLATLALAVVIVFPFLPALLWAVMLSILMYPMYRRMSAKFQNRLSKKSSDTWAASCAALITFVIICVPFILIGAFLYVQISGIVSQLNAANAQGGHGLDRMFANIDKSANGFLVRFGLPHLNLAEYAQQHSSDIVQTFQTPISHAAGRIVFTILSLVIALLAMFFMLRDGHKLLEPAYELLPLPRAKTADILRRIGETVYAVFIGTVLVALLQALCLSIGLKIAGVPSAFLFGVIALFLCTIPLIGASLIYVPAALLLLAEGNYKGAIIVVAVGVVVTKLDYFLRPLLIGGRTNLHPIGIFFGILGGVLVFGPVGLVAGPMVLAVLLALLDVIREKVRGAENTESQPLSATGS